MNKQIIEALCAGDQDIINREQEVHQEKGASFKVTLYYEDGKDEPKIPFVWAEGLTLESAYNTLAVKLMGAGLERLKYTNPEGGEPF